MADLKILNNVLLAPYTTFKIGGLAKYFFEAKNSQEIIEVVRWAKEKGLKYFILGGGSNILISDKGFNGLVIKIKNQKLKIKNNKIFTEAGVDLAKLVQVATMNGLTGLEWAAGIPGTVGGAVRGNAGAFDHSIAENIGGVEILDCHNENQKLKGKNQSYPEQIVLQLYGAGKLKIKSLSNEECQFGYRDSVFKSNSNLIVLSVKIGLQGGDRAELQKKIQGYLEKRKNQPTEPSAGSVFKNIDLQSLDKRLLDEIFRKFPQGQDKIKSGKLPAGWLIEMCNLKGKQIGQAKISEKHANFIVNLGGARAEEVIVLIGLIKQKIRDAFGIQLQEEIEYLNF